MDHRNLWRRIGLVVFACGWLFLLLALGSFHATDWPSHAVYPYPSIQNLCGHSGAFIAYYTFFILGQGVFPILFFSGVCVTLYIFDNRVSDMWLRVIGIALLSAAFACAIHLVRPGSHSGLPEGQGGLLGIAGAAFLRSHCNALVTSLILACTFLVGLLLAADDLVVQAPAFIGSAYTAVKTHTPRFAPSESKAAPKPTKIPAVAKLALARHAGTQTPPRDAGPSLCQRGATALRTLLAPITPAPQREIPKPADQPATAPTTTNTATGIDDVIHLEYAHDEAAVPVADAAFVDAADPQPSEAAIIPPPEQQAVVQTPPPARPEIVVKSSNMIRPRQVSPPSLPPPKELGEYNLPPWDCLAEAEHNFVDTQDKFVREMAAILEQALKEFSIDAHVTEIDPGPVITMYELALAPGVKVSAISALANDIQRALKAETIRIVAPIPGKDTVGIEVPNAQKEKVRLKDLMQLAPDIIRKFTIPIFLGKDASGEPLIHDLAAMPHCLIAGTTGSGKSVCINSIIMSIMYLQRPDLVKLILVDPKIVEMAAFKEIPHLMCPVINDTGRATSVLEWACEKMDERYDLLAEAQVRSIKGYNALTQEELVQRFQPGSPEEEAKIPKKMPYIVIIVDELADLMMTSGKEVEGFIVRLAQKARAVGIHLILATQRPQATVVTGLIKANMPAKIAFRVASKMDSRIVLDQNGAETLLGQGDMLFLPPGGSKPVRSQGTFIDDKEIRESVTLVRGLADAQYEPELVQIKATLSAEDMEKDELFDDAVRVVLETKRGSVSLLQRRLTIGYSRASRLIEQMAVAGIVGDYKGSQAREALITVEEWEQMKSVQQQDTSSGMTV